MSLSAEEMEPSGGNAVLGGGGGERGGRVRWEVPHHSEVSHPKGKWGEGGKFLKKLSGAASVGEYNRVIWFYQLS